MKIYVCVKHVPDTATNITVIGEAGYDESIKFIMNPYDEYALEAAVRIVEQEGGEVVAVTVGKESALHTLRAALAVGADRGIHVRTDVQFLDSFLTSQALKKAIDADGSPDLIFTGKQSVDSEGMQTHYRLAAAFDMPAASEVVTLSMAGGNMLVEREIGAGEREVIEMSLPCILGATKGLNEPRYPKMMDVMKAKSKEVKKMDLSELGLEAFAPTSELLKLAPVPERGRGRMLEGEVRDMVEQMVDLLRNENRVL
jgi:electron transfer flavoprotein beta subunit